MPIDNTFVAKPKLSIFNTRLSNPNMSIGMPNITTYPDNSAGSIKITDNRIVDAANGGQLKDSGRFNVNADKQIIQHVALAAKKHGVDPYTAVAIALQETRLTPGGDTEWNPLHVLDNRADDLVDDGVRQLSEKLAYGKKLGKSNEADIIQAFNGYGKIGKNTEGSQNSFYGIDVSKAPLDLNTNPVYGKRVIDLRDNVIKKNTAIVQMIESSK